CPYALAGFSYDVRLLYGVRQVALAGAAGGHGGRWLVGENQEDDEGPFLPGRLFYAGAGDDRRAGERQLAAQVSRRREHGGRPAARARRLGRSDIVDVAVTIADAEGTEAVSMRRIAKELQVGVMSLYWHIESKEELHQLMLE